MNTRTDLDIKKLKVRLPHQLRNHPDFGNVKIRVDQDQIHFHLNDPKTGLPELWLFDGPEEKWGKVEFLADKIDLRT